MRTVLRTVAAVAALGLAGGGAVVFLGLYNTSADEGHLPGVSWVLHTTFENSVGLRAPPPSEVPELTDAMARLGARHYDAACRPCHAAPGKERTATMEAMLPAPPPITEAVARWQPNELGWIVREGVKMSGMPAWPSEREDEMWAVVAFLTRVQEGLDEETYDRLTAPARAEVPAGLSYCAGCHGLNGRSGNPHIPRLDILEGAYLAEAIRTYLSGARESGIMSHAASELPAELLPEVIEYFAGLPAAGDGQGTDSELAARGRQLAHAATGDREVPACVACHGPRLEGAAPTPPAGPGPAIAGQYEAYLATQLRLWREEDRGGGPRAELMRQAAENLTDGDIAALAAYYAGLAPSGEATGGASGRADAR